MSTERASPYLSVVVTTRNDDHGGDPLKRLQALVNSFDEQCRRTGLAAEVIVVEWNPPAGKPRVSELLRLPDPPHCSYRFVEVPPELHEGLQYADVLPLFQMIAKNVGVRRARGQFILATNIDIIFSTELVEFIAAHRLQPARLYRVDRRDIEPNVPLDEPLDALMQYCRTHQLRVHTRIGSFHVDPLGTRVALADDIVDGRTVRLGDGWHVREGTAPNDLFRWAGDRVELLVDAAMAEAPSSASELEVEIDANPYTRGRSIDVSAVEGGRTLLTTRVAGRVCVRVPLGRLDGTEQRRIELRASNPSGGVPRSDLPVFERRDGMLYRVHAARVRPAAPPRSSLFAYPAAVWTNANDRSSLEVSSTADGLRVVSDPRRFSYCVQYGPIRPRTPGLLWFEQTLTLVKGGISIGVLSGDRRTWLPAQIRQHQDPANTAERRFEVAVDLPVDTRLWLVITNEHPEGDGISEFVLHRLVGDHDPSTVMESGGAAARRAPAPPLSGGAAGATTGAGRVVRLLDPATLRTRLSRLVDRLAILLMSALGSRLRYRLARVTPEFQDLERAVTATDQQLRELVRLGDVADLHKFLIASRPDNLHLNACGDFQLLSREQWDNLRGYPEFETFSMNIDGLFSHMADAAGIKEEILDLPIYHLEHEVGSGWSPEGEALLRRRIAERGITWLDASTIYVWAAYMHWLRRPMIFNGDDWGMATATLAERAIMPAPRATT